MKIKSKSSRRGYYKCKNSRCKQCLNGIDLLPSFKRRVIDKIRRKVTTHKKKTRNKKKNSKSVKKPSSTKPIERDTSDHVIYCIVNTDFFKTRGSLSAEVAKGFLALYLKADGDRLKAKALDNWEDAGKNLLVLNGINHKHLRYLAEEVYYTATETHCLYKNWGKSKIITVLSVLGKQEDLFETLETLSDLR